MKKLLRIGTRGSPLALIQAEMVRTAILKLNPSFATDGEIELVPIQTTGDWKPEMREQTLGDLGANKGLFTKEIDDALISGRIDIAVHSLKDMPTILPRPIELAAVMEREDPRDAFLSPRFGGLENLPQGATVGTASLRRSAQILAFRPDLKIVPLRGNVDTRIRKLEEGVADGTLLAVAGLKRLGQQNLLNHILDTQTMLPAVGQGVLGIAIHAANPEARSLVEPLNHPATYQCITAERALLEALDGSCKTPIAALGRMASDQILVLEGLAASADGKLIVRLQESGTATNANQMGLTLAQKIKDKLPPDFFENLACKS